MKKVVAIILAKREFQALLIIISITLILSVYYLINKKSKQELASPGAKMERTPLPTLTAIPPTPVSFNQDSDLNEELNKLTPEDFTQDYSALKQEAESF